MSSDSFFNWKIPPERKEQARKEAEAYDARELEHAHGRDRKLTGDHLVELALQEKKEELIHRAVEMTQKMQQKIKGSASSPQKPILDDISELKHVLSDLSDLEKTETLQHPHRQSSSPGVKVK